MTDGRVLKLKGRYYRKYPPGQPLGHAEEELTLGLGDTVFLIVDVYGRGYDEGDDLGSAPEVYKRAVLRNRDIVVNYIKPAKVAAKRAALPVVYLTNYLAPSTTANNEWRKLSLRVHGIDALDLWREPNDILAFSRIIAPEADDYLIKKQHYSGFFETHLESLLKELGARNLVVVGFDAPVCLGHTVVDAMYRNYRVIVLRDCIGAPEYVETQEGGWVNWMAVRFIECGVGYTATAADFIQSCQALL